MSDSWNRFNNYQGNEAESIIYRSWQRSRDFKVDHKHIINNDILPTPRFKELYEAHETLIRAGKHILPIIFNLLHGLNFMALLCDNEGYILEALGDPPFLSKTELIHLSPGASWKEEVKGTNAIGTVLKERVPLRIFGQEHFVKENHFLACWAAPIHNLKGELIGVLDISGEASPTNRRILDIVIMGARMIEQNVNLIELQRNFNLYQQGFNLLSEMLKQGFIAIDKSGMITEINYWGAKLLGRKKEDIIGKYASDIFGSAVGWKLNNKSLNLKFSEPHGKEIHLRQINDTSGNSLGAVGTIHPSGERLDENSLWIGRSETSQQVLSKVEKVAPINSSVLIHGESGTGKEIIAHQIHQLSTRHKGPFIALNCAALPTSLIESELFGYADGAFTGAKRGGQPGKFELAHGGTIFLDEIGDMSLSVQIALLRVVQEKEILRIGDTKARKIDVRVITATHKDLTKLIEEGKFRLDLYYRLKVVTLEIPPLRDRLEDLKVLVPYFLNKTCQAFGKLPMSIEDEIYPYLYAHSWPGNVRELENCIESMVALAEGASLSVKDLPPEFFKYAEPLEKPSSDSLLEEQTKQAIIQALTQTQGKIAPAARILGIGRNTLYRKLKEFDIQL